jgi:hypothetical protein
MNIKKLIEQEVNKQEWGLELPKYVMMGGPKGTALRLTDRGTYHRDAGKWDVEYRVEDDKIYSVSPVSGVDGKELTPTTKEEWYEQNKQYYSDENEDDGSFNWTNNSQEFNDTNSYMSESEFDWVDDIPISLTRISDIEHFIGKGMYNIDLETGEPVVNDEGVVVDLTYWIELNGEEPEAYNICWMEDKSYNVLPEDIKICTRFRAQSVINTFKAGEFIFIDNYER